jgi:hypothetical protein
MPRGSPEPDEFSPSLEEDQILELTKQKLKIRNQKQEISKLKQSNKLKQLELEAKNVIITRLVNANDYLSRTAKPEADVEE